VFFALRVLDTSAVFQFPLVASSKSTKKDENANSTHVTSPAAFGSSGLASFASSAESPFNALRSNEL
jgi:hypothetical protein